VKAVAGCTIYIEADGAGAIAATASLGRVRGYLKAGRQRELRCNKVALTEVGAGV
jgi:hypothetical protein